MVMQRSGNKTLTRDMVSARSEYVKVGALAATLGFDRRTLVKYLRTEPFVRQLGNTLVVSRTEFDQWWGRQQVAVKDGEHGAGRL